MARHCGRAPWRSDAAHLEALGVDTMIPLNLMEPQGLSARRANMRQILLYDYTGLPPAEHAALRTAIQDLRTLADVLAWTRKQAPPRSVAEIITQDEYTHDVVLEAAGQPYLAFDTT